MSIIQRFYDVTPKNNKDSNIYQYIDEHEKEFSSYSEDLEKIKETWQIENAENEELDEIGKIYDELGKRRGRDDDDYRAYLKSIVTSFRGRGTVPDIEFAINNALLTGDFEVEIDEIYGEYITEEESFSSTDSGTISQTPIQEDKNTITFRDTVEGVDLTVNFVSGDPTQPSGSNEVNINSITGEWFADASSDYNVTYSHKEMLAYTLTIPEPWEPHSSEGIIEIAEIADASVSHLRRPIIKKLSSENIIVTAEDVQVSTELEGLGSGNIGSENLG